jgi:hypothetical protein
MLASVSALWLSIAAVLAPPSSIVIFSGVPFHLIALRKTQFAGGDTDSRGPVRPSLAGPSLLARTERRDAFRRQSFVAQQVTVELMQRSVRNLLPVGGWPYPGGGLAWANLTLGRLIAEAVRAIADLLWDGSVRAGGGDRGVRGADGADHGKNDDTHGTQHEDGCDVGQARQCRNASGRTPASVILPPAAGSVNWR